MEKIYKSLAAFQQECPVIHKGTSGYGYTYADLPAILAVINPLLKKHKLGFTQLMEENGLRTTLFSTEDGSSITTWSEIPSGVKLSSMNQFQVDGSAITYYRRYMLSAMLGIVTDKDTDASGNQEGSSKEKPSLTPSHKNWEAARKAAKEGKIEAVKNVYKLTAANEKKLLS